MELITAYLYNSAPFKTTGIVNRTFHSLKRAGWYENARSSNKFKLLDNRFKVKNTWYRVVIRFTFSEMVSHEDQYTLNLPCPFIITECERLDTSDRWVDKKTYHGPKMKSTLGYIEEGIPSELIDYVYADLQDCLKYN